MANVTAIIVGLAVIFAIGLYGSAQITTWASDAVKNYSDLTGSNPFASAQSKLLAPQPTTGSTICNLKITVINQLTSDIFSPFPNNMLIVTTHFNWMNCRVLVSTASFLQIPPLYLEQLSNGYNNTSLLRPFDFALLQPVNIPVSIVVSNSQGQQYDSNLLPELTQTIHIPSGLVKEPYSTTLTYLLTNIPRTDYKVSLSSNMVTESFGTSGKLPVGAPVSWTVPASQDSG